MHQTLVCNRRQSGCRDDRGREGLPELLFIEMLGREDRVRTREGGGEREKEEMQLHHKQLREVQGRVSLACLRALLSDYLFRSRLRIITHLREQLHVKALRYRLGQASSTCRSSTGIFPHTEQLKTDGKTCY